MKRAFLFLLFVLAVAAFAQRTATRPYTFAAGDTVRASYFESNYDTVYHVVNDNGDTMNNKFLRTTALKDSVWTRIKVDTISHSPIIDTILECNKITGNPVVDSIDGPVRIDFIKLGNSASFLGNYIDTTFEDTLYDNTTYRASGTARVVQIGKIVTLYQPALTGSITSGSAIISGVPTKFNPPYSFVAAIQVLSNSVYTDGIFSYGSDNFLINLTSGSGLTSGTGGTGHIVLTWIIN
jgi:hypothetical protein